MNKTTLSLEPLKLNSRCILFLAMLFVTASVAADAVAYKFCLIGPLIESGATLAFPLTYILGDIIAEVYGYSMARRVIWFSLGCEIIFATLIWLIVQVPTAPNFPHQAEYKDVFDPILRFVLSCIIGDIISSFINIYAISKFKILLQGKNFILRSIAATAVGEAVMNIIACSLAFFGITPYLMVLKVILYAYLLELFYAAIFAIPALFIIMMLKRLEKIDAYDYNINYNPFKLA